jgi:DHA2 family multidrug resistance protein
MYQYFYLIPIYYEKLKGLSSIQTGLGVLGFGIWIGFFSIIAGILSDKFSPIPVLLVGVLLYLWSAFFLFPSLNYYTPFYEAVLKTMPFGIAMGLFFAPITTLIMINSTNNEQAIVVMDYVRFVGGSFGTAIATNNLYFYTNKEFQGMVELQSYESVYEFLHFLKQKLGIVAEVLFRKIESFMSFNYAFKYVWLDAAFWGAVGSVFIFMLLFKRRVQ